MKFLSLLKIKRNDTNNKKQCFLFGFLFIVCVVRLAETRFVFFAFLRGSVS